MAKVCCHCGVTTSPCWRRGPPEKPLLCNACGARYLVKKSLSGYARGLLRQQAAGLISEAWHDGGRPASPSGSSWQQQASTPPSAAAAATGSSPRAPADSPSAASSAASAAHHAARRRPASGAARRQPQQRQPQRSEGGDGAQSAVSGLESHELLGVQCGRAAAADGRKRSRLVSTSVCEIDVDGAALRCERTFETPDGGRIKVVRRLRKQLTPRASSS